MDSPSVPGYLTDEVDRKALTRIVQRFRRHHALRYWQSGRRMPAQQRAMLQALPLLYHWNHPALPGFVSHGTPAGIACYAPQPETLLAVQRFTRSFRAPRFESPEADLQAMFIMGSGGSVGQTRKSDIDLWICCDTLLHPRLWPKVRAVDAWARSIGLDLHTFLVDPDVLREEGRLPGAHAPTLLLDEFYRSAVLLAGRYPLWWLIPEDDPPAYAATARRLLHYRFVPRNQVLDFGPVPVFPDDELAQAAAAELRRCLRTPEKSLLKLKLIEAYTESGAQTLSSEYRRRIHAGEADPLRLDPYLMLYGWLEAWCQRRGEGEMLRLIRRLLISKTADNVRLLDLQSPTAAGATLSNLFRGWGFSTAEIKHLRAPHGWSIEERKARSDAMIAAMRDGLALTEGLIQRAAARTEASAAAARSGRRQLGWLNRNRLRHLRSAIERLAAAQSGEIHRLHPAMATDRFAVPATLQRTGSGWSLGRREAPAYTSPRLVQAIAWAEINRVRLSPAPAVRRHLRAMAQIRAGLREGDVQTEAVHVFVNAEPPRHPSPGPGQVPGGTAESPLQLLTRQTDPLDYSGLHQLHLRCFDVIRRDAEGRWHSTAYPGGESLQAALTSLFELAPHVLRWHVIGGQEVAAVRRRLRELHRWGHQALAEPGGVFIMPFGAENLLLIRAGSTVTARRFQGLEEMESILRRINPPRVQFDPASRRFAGQHGVG